jgi:endo-alpha-1,4-polygalactosaminidase (GH114 family)
MTTTKIHAIDIAIQDDVLSVTPYKLAVEGDVFVKSNIRSGRQLELKLKNKQNRDVIAYILDSEEWDSIRTYWDGYLNKEFTTYLTIGDTPARVQSWLDKLPEYKISLGGK